MPTALRRVVAVLGGLAAAMIIITFCEGLSGRLYPPPAGFDKANREVVRAYIAALPVVAVLLVLAGYALAALVGGWLATRLSKAASLRPAMIVGAILLGGSVMNLRDIPHPAWFGVVNLLLVIVLPLIGARFAWREAPSA